MWSPVYQRLSLTRSVFNTPKMNYPLEKKDSTNAIFVKPCSKVRNKKVTTDVEYWRKIRNGEKIIARFVNYRFLGVKALHI